MSDAIIDTIALEYAPQMLMYAMFAIQVARALRSNEARLHKNAQEIAGHYYSTNHTVGFMDMDDLRKIETMGRLIAYDTETTIHGESKIESAAYVGNTSSGGRVKMTAYSLDKIKNQAVRLRGIRHAHARKAVALIRKLGATVKHMQRLEAKILRSMENALRVAGLQMDNIEDMGFEHAICSFAWVLEQVNEALGDAQTVADARVPPLLPSE
jgi:hypothetical protein